MKVDVSVRQVVDMTRDSDKFEYLCVLDTCGRMWRGEIDWSEDVPKANWLQIPLPQVEDPAAAMDRITTHRKMVAAIRGALKI